MALYNTVVGTFKNEPTKRFYEFLRQKVDNKSLTMEEISTIFRKPSKDGDDTPSSNDRIFLSQLKNGKNSITVEQIIKAQYALQLSPGFLFGELDSNPGSLVNENIPLYAQPGDKQMGAVLRSIFKKHETEVKSYAETRLTISEQQLHNYFSGKSRIPMDVVITICQDHSESLDLFRTAPLPKGHLLEKNRHLEALVAAQSELLSLYQNQKPHKS